MSQYQHISKPLRLRHKTLKNRIVFGAHTANMSDLGLPGDRHLGYYLERAKGGAAMIVVEPVPVHANAVLTRGNFRHNDDAVIPGFKRITKACKAEGAVMIHQLYHVGMHGDADLSYLPNWSPSGLPSYHDSDGSHAMSDAEIEETIEGFVDSADRAQRSGFDGIELFGAYHSIIEQFWMSWSNQREDKWGGNFEKRMRFSVEIIKRIRTRVGDDFIIGMATSVDESQQVTLLPDDLGQIVAYLDERELVDYFTVGTGSYFESELIIPVFAYGEKLTVNYTETLKKIVKHALIQSEAQIRNPENADYTIASGQADMVSIVRGQIADPYLVNKALAGQEERIRGCISCNQQCWGRRSRDYWISCLVNPSAGREFEWGGDRFVETDNAKRVTVVGGGPAGLEVSRVAAERGHRVRLHEAASQLGGNFSLAGLQPRRGQITDLMAWYQRELRRLNVEVEYNSFIEAADVAESDCDALLIATGSQPSATGCQKYLPAMDRLPGIDKINVGSIEDAMTQNMPIGKQVIVLDELGDWRGCGTAWFLAELGHSVTLVTTDGMVGKGLIRSDANYIFRQTIARLGVQCVTDSVITEWHGDSASVKCMLTGEVKSVEADSLVLATVNRPLTELESEMTALNKGIDIYSIGDCVAPRTAVMAIYEGRKLGLEL